MTRSQWKFVELYHKTKDAYSSYEKAYPNAGTTAAKKAGIKRLLNSTEVQDALAGRKLREVADMDEIKRFWTRILRDKDAKVAERLKVSELLAKAEGAVDAPEAPFKVILSSEANEYAG